MTRSFANHVLAILVVAFLLHDADPSRAEASATNVTPAAEPPAAARMTPTAAPPVSSWDGPMRAHTTAPFHILRPTPTTLTPPGYRRVHATRLDLDVTWGNIWLYSPDVYRFDGEWVWVRLAAQQQFGRASLKLSATAVARSGGVLDPAIDRFHARIGRGNGTRTAFPRGETVLSVGPEGTLFNLQGPGRSLGDTSLAFAWTLMEPTETRPAVSTELLVTFPTGDADELAGLGHALYGLGLLIQQPIGRSGASVYGGLVASHTDAESLAGLRPYALALSQMVGAEYAWNRRWSALVQYIGDSATVKGARELSKAMHDLAVGVRRRGAGRTTVEVCVAENLARFGNSADIELHAGLRHVF